MLRKRGEDVCLGLQFSPFSQDHYNFSLEFPLKYSHHDQKEIRSYAHFTAYLKLKHTARNVIL